MKFKFVKVKEKIDPKTGALAKDKDGKVLTEPVDRTRVNVPGGKFLVLEHNKEVEFTKLPEYDKVKLQEVAAAKKMVAEAKDDKAVEAAKEKLATAQAKPDCLVPCWSDFKLAIARMEKAGDIVCVKRGWDPTPAELRVAAFHENKKQKEKIKATVADIVLKKEETKVVEPVAAPKATAKSDVKK